MEHIIEVHSMRMRLLLLRLLFPKTEQQKAVPSSQTGYQGQWGF